MKKRIKLLCLCLTCIVFNSCVSGTIVGSGKSYKYLLNAETSISDVRESLGSPSWSKSYDPPVQIKSTKIYKSHKSSRSNSAPSIWNGTESELTKLTSLCEIYTRKGPYADTTRGQAYGMIGGMTLGVGDVILLPSAINEKSEMNKKYYSLTFWYDAEGYFVGYYNGDIREVRK